MKNPEPDFYACLNFDCFLKNEHEVFANIIMQRMQLSEVTFIQEIFVFKIYNLLFQDSTPWLDFSVLGFLSIHSDLGLTRKTDRKEAVHFCKTSFYEW